MPHKHIGETLIKIFTSGHPTAGSKPADTIINSGWNYNRTE